MVNVTTYDTKYMGKIHIYSAYSTYIKLEMWHDCPSDSHTPNDSRIETSTGPITVFNKYRCPYHNGRCKKPQNM